MKVGLIVAMDSKNGIGKNNDLMWHLPNDMKFFKETTTGHIVEMGRKNFESIPEKFRPLPNRENVVLTRNVDYTAEGVKVFHSLREVITFYENEDNRTVFIIGGGEIYKEALRIDCVDEMYVTHVDKSFDADTFFPEIINTKWSIETIQTQLADEKHEAGFSIKKYTKN